jgi:hypothetical protein
MDMRRTCPYLGGSIMGKTEGNDEPDEFRSDDKTHEEEQYGS